MFPHFCRLFPKAEAARLLVVLLEEMCAQVDEGVVAHAGQPTEVAEQLVRRGGQLTLTTAALSYNKINVTSNHITSS